MRLRKETKKIKRIVEDEEKLLKFKFSAKKCEGVGKDVFVCKYDDCRYQIKPCQTNKCPLKKTPCHLTKDGGEKCKPICKDH